MKKFRRAYVQLKEICIFVEVQVSMTQLLECAGVLTERYMG